MPMIVKHLSEPGTSTCAQGWRYASISCRRPSPPRRKFFDTRALSFTVEGTCFRGFEATPIGQPTFWGSTLKKETPYDPLEDLLSWSSKCILGRWRNLTGCVQWRIHSMGMNQPGVYESWFSSTKKPLIRVHFPGVCLCVWRFH